MFLCTGLPWYLFAICIYFFTNLIDNLVNQCLNMPNQFSGRHCEQVIDACYGQPCINEGVCKVLEEGRFRLAE